MLKSSILHIELASVQSHNVKSRAGLKSLQTKNTKVFLKNLLVRFINF